MNAREVLFGSIAGLVASAVWAVASVLYSRVPVRAQAMATFKNVFATVLIGLVLFASRFHAQEPFFQATSRSWSFLGLSAVFGLAIGDVAFFRSLQLIGPRLGLTLTLLSPPLISLMGKVFLNETLAAETWMATGVTLIGLAIVMRERAGNKESDSTVEQSRLFWLGVGFALLNILCHCGGSILMKVGTEGLGTVEATFIRLFVASCVMLPVGLCTGQSTEIRNLARDRGEFLKLACAAFLGTFLGVWLMLTSFKYCPAGIAAIMTSTSPIFVIPIVWLACGERVSRTGIVGAAIAFGGVCWLLLPTA